MTEWIDKRERMPQKSDEDSMGRILVYNIYGGVMISGSEDFATFGGKYCTHWMKIPIITDGWIPLEERKPTQEEEDESGCILGYNQLHGAHTTNVGNLMAYGGKYETHWRPMPPRPELDKEYLAEVRKRI